MENGNGKRYTRIEKAARKFIPDYKPLAEYVKGHQAVGDIVVLTIGSWDALHIGHVRYCLNALEESNGDILILGVDTDRTIQLYKKDDSRPIIPQSERVEMLTYLDVADRVTLIDDVDENGKWQYGLIKAIRPDVFVAVEESYPEAQREEISQYCGSLLILPRQAETSTSDIFRRMMIKLAALLKPLMQQFQELLDGLVSKRG